MKNFGVRNDEVRKYIHKNISKEARAFLCEEILNQWLIVIEYAIYKFVVI